MDPPMIVSSIPMAFKAPILTSKSEAETIIVTTCFTLPSKFSDESQ
jgi:hypothetical protein